MVKSPQRWHIAGNWCYSTTGAGRLSKPNIISISALRWHCNLLLRFPCLCVSGKGWLSGHITAAPLADPGECPAPSVSDPKRRQLPAVCVSRQADKGVCELPCHDYPDKKTPRRRFKSIMWLPAMPSSGLHTVLECEGIDPKNATSGMCGFCGRHITRF